MAEFFAMGTHGAYVWPAFGLSALVLGVLVWLRWRRLVAAEKRAQKI
ncbi:MAG: heme exporter protein CcmD [Alphaproteobacteria bacterium]